MNHIQWGKRPNIFTNSFGQAGGGWPPPQSGQPDRFFTVFFFWPLPYATPSLFRFSLDPAPVFRQSSKINFIVSMQHTIQYCITHHHWLGNRVFSTERYLSHNKKPTQQDVFIIGRDHQIISPAWYIKLYHQVIIVEEIIKLYHQVNDQGQQQVSCTFSYFWIPLFQSLNCNWGVSRIENIFSTTEKNYLVKQQEVNQPEKDSVDKLFKLLRRHPRVPS